eukprot:scaffold997_cov418-Prasinococcus_capsulatus_cf.AAC.1
MTWKSLDFYGPRACCWRPWGCTICAPRVQAAGASAGRRAGRYLSSRARVGRGPRESELDARVGCAEAEALSLSVGAHLCRTRCANGRRGIPSPHPHPLPPRANPNSAPCRHFS